MTNPSTSMPNASKIDVCVLMAFWDDFGEPFYPNRVTVWITFGDHFRPKVKKKHPTIDAPIDAEKVLKIMQQRAESDAKVTR